MLGQGIIVIENPWKVMVGWGGGGRIQLKQIVMSKERQEKKRERRRRGGAV